MSDKKRVLYITTVDRARDPGVYKKIKSQKHAIEKLSCRVDLVYFDLDSFFYNDSQGKNIRLSGSAFARTGFWSRFIYPSVLSDFKFAEYDLIYIRKSFISTGFLSFLRSIKRRNSNVKIILEIPTFPYFRELNGVFKKALYSLELVNSFVLRKYIDRIVYVGNLVERIWGIEAVRFSNGIELQNIPVRSHEDSNNSITKLVGVANLADWHGYDRVIRGIEKLDPKHRKSVEFHIVGEGPALQSLKLLVEKLNLSEHIRFHGFKSGEELDSIINNADVCVASLGLHRLGLREGSTLKVKEFIARGVPFICGYRDYALPEYLKFMYNVSATDEPVEIIKILDWYKSKFPFDKNEIRNYADQNLGWDKQVRVCLRGFIC